MMHKMKTNWTIWQPIGAPEQCRQIAAPAGPGVYQLQNKKTKQMVLFGIGVECKRRMKSLFPAPYGTGKRNNGEKREYVLKHWRDIEYRTFATATREQAKLIEDEIKTQRTHIFNT
jgi:hypothetical protein